MMRSTLGAPLGGTTRGGHQGFESVAISLITPPNGGAGAGSCFPLTVVVASAEPNCPVTTCALELDDASTSSGRIAVSRANLETWDVWLFTSTTRVPRRCPKGMYVLLAKTVASSPKLIETPGGCHPTAGGSTPTLDPFARARRYGVPYATPTLIETGKITSLAR